MKAVLTALVFFLSFPMPLLARGSGAPSSNAGEVEAQIDAWFFYEELCGSCRNDLDRFTEILREQLPLAERDAYPHFFHIFNIYETEGRSRYVRVTDEMGLERETLTPPLLIIGGRVFQGYDSIQSNIREAYLTGAEDLFVNKKPYNHRTRKTGANLFEDYPVNSDNVTVVYFYRITCGECAKVTPLIDALPETVFISGKERRIDVIRMNTRSGNNSERIAAFFEAWRVPDKDRMVPIVFFSDSYLAGYEAIAAGLSACVRVPPVSWKLLPMLSRQ